MNIICHKSAFSCFMALLLFSFHPAGYGAEAQKKKASVHASITVTVKEGQSIRGISEEYLSDPNLWEDILHANHMTRADQVRAGMALHIPVEAITLSNQALENARQLIRQATEAGAKIFAPRAIASAIGIRDRAIENRQAGKWSDAIDRATAAAEEARKALNISRTYQDVPAEARVAHYRGQVHRKRPSDNLWKDISRDEILMEGEKVRTLSQSYAEILFRDDSRLQLRENAQALIRKMRANLLKDSGEAKVSLISGDVLALIAGKEAFHLEVEGVEMKINSRRFRAGRDEEKDVAWFAVDDGEVEIRAKGKKVVLKKNQGSIVARNQKPSDPRDLLPPPRLTAPPDGEDRFDLTAPLAWEPVKGAGDYLLEISDNAAFSGVLWSEKVPENKGNFPGHLGPGAYYWRVTAVDPDKLPGRVSKGRFIRIIADNEPPFLVIHSPKPQAILSENRVEIAGVTEADATLTIICGEGQGARGVLRQAQEPGLRQAQEPGLRQAQEPGASGGSPLAVRPSPIAHCRDDGTYRFRCSLSEGENRLVVQAKDRAGNVRQLERTVIFLPAGKIDLSFAPLMRRIGDHLFLVRHHHFTLAGKTYPKGCITVASVPLDSTFENGGDGRATSDERPVVGDQRVTENGGERRAASGERPMVGGERPAVGGQRVTASDERPAVGGDRRPLAAHPLPLTADRSPLARRFSARTMADAQGRFQMNLQAEGEKDTFIIEVITRAGEVRKSHFTIELDNQPPVIRFDKDIPSAITEKRLTIEGRLEGGVRLNLNGEDIPLKKTEHPKISRFKFQTTNFKPQVSSPLRFTAYDQAGNVTWLEKEVLFDPDPPQFVRYDISPRKAKGGEKTKVTVQAKDVAGLAKIAPFTAQVGEYVHKGMMTRSGQGAYIGLFQVPKHIRGRVRLKQVTLSDYLGNKREMRIER